MHKKTLATLTVMAFALTASAAVLPQAHYNLKGADVIRDPVAPEIWKSQVPGGPALARQGSPRLVASAPDSRRQVSRAALSFERPDQCYSVAKNLVSGDNFVLEAWA
jgi:hypothetical protein